MPAYLVVEHIITDATKLGTHLLGSGNSTDAPVRSPTGLECPGNELIKRGGP